MLHPTGGIPAALGFYGGVAIWSPAGVILDGLLPYPVDRPVAWGPGEAIGTGIGLVLGAPFHLVALPFSLFSGGEGEEPPPAEPPVDPSRPREPAPGPGE